MARIPPKGTPEYKAYWRDRHMLEDMQATRKSLTEVIRRSAPGRLPLYVQAERLFDQAIEQFKLGHMFSYTGDER